MKSKGCILAHVAWSIFAIGLFVGLILFTLTYTKVPVEYQHLWFGDDLHTFLMCEHIADTVLMIVALVAGNVAIAIKFN